jgi:hypothetical protein
MSPTLLVGTRKGLLVVENTAGGRSISATHFRGVPVSCVLHDSRDGAWYAGLDHGHFGVKLHRSDDLGASWVELPYPTYPADCADDPAAPPFTQLLWTIEAGHPDQPGVLWCGTIPGGLFRSPDRGETWELVRSMWDHPLRKEGMGGGYDHPGVHSISIDPRSADGLVVGVSVNGIWRTTDGAATWELATGLRAAFCPPDMAYNPQIQDAHRIARCAAAPDVLWLQHHNGIFRSTDGGSTFHEFFDVEPTTFGFPVAVHPRDPDTAWFVPAESDEVRIPKAGEMVVTRTRDGGQSFDIVRSGLPAADAFQLVYRHGLDVDPTGQHLAMGSTTGSLWFSDDSGEHFTRFSAELPPLLCVRWAA